MHDDDWINVIINVQWKDDQNILLVARSRASICRIDVRAVAQSLKVEARRQKKVLEEWRVEGRMSFE